MNPPPASLSQDAGKPAPQIRSIELGPSRKRERLVQQVRAARKRLAPSSSERLGEK